MKVENGEFGLIAAGRGGIPALSWVAGTGNGAGGGSAWHSHANVAATTSTRRVSERTSGSLSAAKACRATSGSPSSAWHPRQTSIRRDEAQSVGGVG